MVVFPKAKINLGLMIKGKRPDGYHDIETILYPVDLCDALEVVKNTGDSASDILTISGEIPEGNPEDNLVLKAVRKLRETYRIPYLRMHLYKKIPSGAGLGGGSSDAANTVRIINKEFNLGIDPDEMRNIVVSMGTDCPFFVDSVPSIATGRGDILYTAEPFLEGFYLLLLHPGFSVSTREAYEGCEPSDPGVTLKEAIRMRISEWRKVIVNDFEKTVFQRYPQIRDLKEALNYTGALYSSMSGSGSAVYGIYAGEPVVPEGLKKYLIYKGKF
ncbi:MAG: 4-(cytidine 5'-diphospho)-2-C-methyl-D-erythritol kinase [Bacteroidota bacterium]|nr:4-(cytidine 5'-diphospho)-2-C-methyl-D-erythritol kinase [Bacteroidota bacterium]